MIVTPPNFTRSEPPKRRRRWPFIAGGAAVFLVLFGFGIYRWGWHGGVTRIVTTVLPYPAAIVDGAVIRYGDFEDNVAVLERFYETERKRAPAGSVIPDGAEIRKRVLDRMIRDRLAENLASRYGVDIGSSDVTKAYESSILDQSARGNTAARAKAELQAEESLDTLYGLSKSQFKDHMLRPFLVRQKLQEVLAKDETLNAEKRKKAEAALAELKAGKDFKSVAIAYSEDPAVAATGGDRGLNGPGLLPAEVDKEAFALQPGDLGPIITSALGYHVIKVSDLQKSKDGKVEKVHLYEILVKPIQVDDYLNVQMKSASIIILVQ